MAYVLIGAAWPMREDRRWTAFCGTPSTVTNLAAARRSHPHSRPASPSPHSNFAVKVLPSRPRLAAGGCRRWHITAQEVQMPVKQKQPRNGAGEEQGGVSTLAADGHEGVEYPLIPVDRVVGAEGVFITDGHQSVSSEDGAPGGGGAGQGGKGEVESVPGYQPRLAEAGRFAEAAPLADAGPAVVETGDDGQPLMDAWYAEFGDPSSTLARRGELTRVALEVVIGADDRTQITNTTIPPWRWICSLRITAGNGAQFIGTGWLVGARTVLTAGHCVYMHSQGGWVREIEVIPGRNGASRPFGSCRATAFRSVNGWIGSHDRDFDYGAILLPTTHRYGDQLGIFGYAALSDADLLNLTLNLSGYPGDKPAGTQWFHARVASSVTPRTIVYNIDTAGGQSGSPVWRLRDGQRHAVGIHTNGALSGNSATRIIPEVAANIGLWKAAAP
jgi:V8-like Glu-specific endopeptidase